MPAGLHLDFDRDRRVHQRRRLPAVRELGESPLAERPRTVPLPPGLLDVLLRAMLARRTLVMEPVLGTPTTTRTPQPPNRSLDLVPHDGTPPSLGSPIESDGAEPAAGAGCSRALHRVSTGRVPRSPGLRLGPVPAGLVLIVELVVAGLTTTPPPQPCPHRLDPVQHARPPLTPTVLHASTNDKRSTKRDLQGLGSSNRGGRPRRRPGTPGGIASDARRAGAARPSGPPRSPTRWGCRLRRPVGAAAGRSWLLAHRSQPGRPGRGVGAGQGAAGQLHAVGR
jgi:hypothetical protein